jgi:phosphatidylglycerophosphate synthase
VGAGLTLPAEPSATVAEGLLVVLPPEDGAARDVSGDTLVAGVALLRRIALAGVRAGFSGIVVARPRPTDSNLVAGTGATLLSSDVPLPVAAFSRIVLLPANVVPRPQSLRRLLEIPLEPDRLYVDPTVTVVDVKDASPVLRLASRCANVAELRAALRSALHTEEARLDVAAGVPLAGAADVPLAETWLLRGLIKPNEGFMSRHFERRLSLAVTRRLVRTRLTPNAMTLVSVAIGLAGAPFFLSSAPVFQVIGALLFLTHSILDGCDGELARLKFLESRGGAVLDFWGDNVVHGAVFTAIAVGWAVHAGALWPLALGALAVVSTGLVALTVWRRGLLAWTLDEHAPPRARLVAALVHRDFIYVILALAMFGKAGWFVVVTAVGAPLFFGVLAWVGRGRPTA